MPRIIILIFAAMGFFSCKKDTLSKNAISLIVVNAVPDSKPLATNFNGTGPVRFIDTRKITYGMYNPFNSRFEMAAGKVLLGLYQYPDTLAKDNPLFNFTFDFESNSINTLFLTGTSTATDTMLVKDNIPWYQPADSSMGVRLVNLIPGSDPVNLNLVGKPDGSEAHNVGYKNITAFKKYDVLRSVTNYTFECYNAVTGNFIARYQATGIGSFSPNTANTWIYKNFTLALMGKKDGTGAEAPKLVLVTQNT